MTVKELIEFLQVMPHELQVAYRLHSEQCLLDKNDIWIQVKGEPRPDGWIHDARPDKPTQEYLMFPGN
jgi:hypothetical protein